MSQSLYTAMGGIASAQSQLNVVSNNIANINTVGFKESSVTFQDIFSTTVSAGNAPTVVTGGTNPIQIGLGVQVGTIAKNFTEGTWTATGQNSDMMIQGNGFFAVKSSTGEVFLTRAGNFTVDSNGDLVNAQGYKVVGADKLYGTTSSAYNVHIPQKIVTKVSPNEALATNALSDLNDCSLTMGSFNIVINNDEANPVKVTLTNEKTMADVVQTINNTLAASKTAATTAATTATTVAGYKTTEATNYTTVASLLNAGGAITDPAVVTALNNAATARAAAGDAPLSPPITTAAGATSAATAATTAASAQTQIATDKTAEAARYAGINCSIGTGDATGTVQFSVNGTTAKSLKFVSAGTNSSNFALATSLGSAALDPATNTYTSKVLDYKVNVTPVTSLDNAVSISNYTIADDGSISATYSNGDKLTIEKNQNDQTFRFKYTTSTGVIIRGTDVTVDQNVAVPANLQIQLANVVNPEGLVAAGGNLYQSGPNSGDMMFTVGSAMGMGKIKSGGLEASNVDLSKQFSDMIVAQRAVQANSRVFTTTSDIMQTLVSLGR